MKERLQKLIASAGLCARRTAEDWIAAGRVCVNGAVASLGDRADLETDTVTVDGAPLPGKPGAVYLMLNKPRGYVTTLSDEYGRRTAAELVADCGVRVYPVGRLDRDSEGLLLFTNDGELAQRLLHPRHQVDKVYLVWVSGYIAGKEKSLGEPIEIDGRMTTPAQVSRLHAEGATALFRITIHEGRNRQIRRLCERAGLTVTRLRRIAEGALQLGDLKPGQSRALTEQELTALRREIEK